MVARHVVAQNDMSDFCIIMRENAENPGELEIASSCSEVSWVPATGKFYQYEDMIMAVNKAKEYVRLRRRQGCKYRYYILRTVAIVEME